MANFDQALNYVLTNEGGWADDSGGWTMWGVTVPCVAINRGIPQDMITEKDMRELTIEEAKEIYLKQFWTPMQCQRIDSQEIATCLLDTGVNRGQSVAMRYAQKACNIVLDGMASQLMSLTIDGQIGPQTLVVLNVIDPLAFIRAFEHLEEAGYLAVIANNPDKYERYRHSWMLRAERLLTLVSA